MSSSRLTTLLAVALAGAACHKGPPATFAPTVSRVDPAGGPQGSDVSIIIAGEHFYARVAESHGGVRIDDGYEASLDGIPLRDVVRVSDTELRAVVPAGLPAGQHVLLVTSPFDQTASLARGYVVSDVPPARLVAFTKAPAQVSTGQSFTIDIEVQNAGGASAVGVSPSALQIGGTATVTTTGAAPAAQDIPGGESRVFSFAMVATHAGSISVAASASGTDQVSQRPVVAPSATGEVVVQQRGALQSVAQAPAPQVVSVGQTVSLTIVATNSGTATADALSFPVPAVGPSLQLVSSPAPQDVAGAMGTASLTWTYQAVQPGIESPSVDGGIALDCNDGAPIPAPGALWPNVVVQAPARISVSPGAVPAKVSVGQTFTVTAVVTNNGEATAKAVLPVVTPVGTAAATVLGKPPPAADIGGGASATFSFSLKVTTSGTLSVSFAAAGSDANSAAAIQAAAASSQPVTVQGLPKLATTAIASPGEVSTGQAVHLAVTVTNSGEATAINVLPFIVVGGPAGLVQGPGPAQTIASGATATFTYTYSVNSLGTIDFTILGDASDQNTNQPISFPFAVSNKVTVVQAASITASGSLDRTTASVGQDIVLTVTVTNTGGVDANNVTPSVKLTGTAAATFAALAAQTVPPGSSVDFRWTFRPTSAGTLTFSPSFVGIDSLSGLTLFASPNPLAATVQTAPPEATLLAADPFADGTTSASLASFSGQLWVGPSASGSSAVRMNGDGSSAQVVSWLLERSADASNGAYTGSPAQTIGAIGCAVNTAGCGPNNESGGGLFFSALVSGMEWLGLTGGYPAGATDSSRFVYLTASGFPLATGGVTDFAYSDLGSASPATATDVTSAVVFHDRLYLGFEDAGGPALASVVTMPALPGAAASAADLGAQIMPGIGGSGSGMIDSMAVLGLDTLYLANANGFAMTSNPAPSQCTAAACSDWADATPNAPAFQGKPAITTGKTSNLQPADRAVPAMASFGGRLFAARNTVDGPQLWSCAPSSATQCTPGDWSLVAPNGSGDAMLTQFNDPSNSAVTLLAATSQHLYVGFDNGSGVVLYRTSNPGALSISDFTGRFDASCPAIGTCQGFGGNGLGSGATRIFDGKALTISGTEGVYAAAGDGTSPVQIFGVVR
ncbi:MAG: hypothetical protein ACJ781_08700 [Myxococcales bacterium]